jgi:hypothetical protein
MKKFFKGYQPQDNGKGSPNQPPSLKKEEQNQQTALYRLIEIRRIGMNEGNPMWSVQVYNEQGSKWSPYGTELIYDQEIAKRYFDIATGKLSTLTVLDQVEVLL